MMALWLILICVGVVSADVPELRGMVPVEATRWVMPVDEGTLTLCRSISTAARSPPVPASWSRTRSRPGRSRCGPMTRAWPWSSITLQASRPPGSVRTGPGPSARQSRA